MKGTGLVYRIAWRNIWRNSRRSMVLMGAVAVGVFSFIGSTAFTDGFGAEFTNAAVALKGGHLQVARSGFHENPTIRSRITEWSAIADAVEQVPGAEWAPTVTTPGMVNSANQASGVVINGVDPVREASVTEIAARMSAGAFAEPGGVTIGVAMAEQLHVELGDKVVLMVSDLHNEVSAGAYKVTGLYRSGSTPFDKSNVYLPIAEAQRLLGYDDAISTIAARIPNGDLADGAARRLREALAGEDVEVMTHEDRNPMLRMAQDAYDYSAFLTAIILFTAVGFTLVNSFLMVIYERIHEFGVMLAGGTPPGIIRSMLFAEAMMVALLGSALGVLLSVAGLAYWTINGLDLSAASAGLGEFGVSTIIYPVYDWSHLGFGFLIIIAMVALAVLYPAIKASLFRPVEAMNHV